MIGRVLTNIVSAFQRDRVHYGQMYASEAQTLTTNFNGAIPKGATITSAVWQTDDTMTGYLSDAQIVGRSVSVKVRAQHSGRCRIRVTITTDAGSVLPAWHVVRVLPAPYLGNEGWTNGPRRLEVVA